MSAVQDLMIIVAALGFVAMGAAALVAPNRVTEQFDIPPLSAAGRNEIRAVYGGFGLAMAAMLGVAVWSSDLRTGICLTIAAALGGMAVGRLISAVTDRTFAPRPLLYFVIEAVLTGLILVGGAV